MPHEIVNGEIVEIYEDGSCCIKTKLPSIDRAILRKYKDVLVSFSDGRSISATQRRKIYALIGEIADFVGDDLESQKNTMKMDFVLNHLQAIERRMFSLSNVSMTIAREFIDYLIEFIISNDIPTSVPLIENCEDIGKYIYACTLNRKCCVCGKPADIHHITGSKIGIGSDRQEVHHLGREVLPLCRVHHDECHHNEVDFMNKYHLEAVKLDETLCKKLKLKK